MLISKDVTSLTMQASLQKLSGNRRFLSGNRVSQSFSSKTKGHTIAGKRLGISFLNKGTLTAPEMPSPKTDQGQKVHHQGKKQQNFRKEYKVEDVIYFTG